MLKNIGKILKKIIFSCFLLYGFNVLAQPLNIMVPINILNVGLITVLGMPVLFSLIFIHVLVF